MALYAIGDLHLCLGAPKPMDIFGGAWVGYTVALGDKRARFFIYDLITLAVRYKHRARSTVYFINGRGIGKSAEEAVLIKGKKGAVDLCGNACIFARHIHYQ